MPRSVALPNRVRQGAAPPSAPARHPWLEALGLAVVTVAVFWPTLSAELVYDSRMQILTDSFLFDPANWVPVLSFQTLALDVLDFNRPVNLASLMLDATLWGRAPFGYHLTSVLLHALDVVLVWRLLRQLAPALPLAAGVVAPLLFAVHPLVTEAVCEPSYREDILVALFTLTGLSLALGHRSAPGRPDVWRALGCIGCALLAIGSKESGIAAPTVIAVAWLALRRDDCGAFWKLAGGGAAAVVLAFLAARFVLEPNPSKIFEARPSYPGGSLAAALLIEPRILALYAQLVVLPVNLCADYGLHSLTHLPLPVALVIDAVAAIAGVVAIRADRRFAIAATLVVVPLLSVANLVPIYRPAADRYLYLPVAGLALAVGVTLDAPWLARRPRWRGHAARILAGLAVVLGAACISRQTVWRDSLALWTDTARKNPLSFTASAGSSEALREAGRLQEAEAAARRAVALTGGGFGDAWATLALIVAERGRSDEAFAHLDRALEVNPKLTDPDGRVAVKAMERPYADELKRLLARRRAAP